MVPPADIEFHPPGCQRILSPVTNTSRPDEPPRSEAEQQDVQIRTFLIADVRGYTLFTQQKGDELAAKLATKFADIAREGVEGRGGTLLELRGDEALCVFASARNAIRAAVDLQLRFVEETVAEPELPLTVGIGLDAGEAVPVHGGYRGGALNLAARLCGLARAGEIIVSREVTHLARRMDGVRYEDRGSVSLKGLDDPVAISQVIPEDADPVELLRPFAPPSPEPPKRSRSWKLPVAIVAALAVVAITVTFLRPDKGAPVHVGTNSVALMNAEDGTPELSSELGQRPGASAIGFDSLWVAEPDRGVVARLDLDDGSVVDPSIRVGNSPSGVAVGAGSVWVANAADGTVSRISVETNEETTTLPAGSVPSGIAFGGGSLWVADTVGAALLRIDPSTGKSESVPLAGQPTGVVFADDAVWVSIAPAGVARIDPADLTVTLTQTVGNGPTAIVAAFGSIWVANYLDGTVTRLDPSTGREEATIPVGEGPNSLAAAGSSLWVANTFDDAISAVDPASNTSDAPVPVDGVAGSLTAGGDGLWLAVGASAAEHRGGTLTISAEVAAPVSMDPAVIYAEVGASEILSITNDTLVTYKKVGGPDGATLVPDLASSLPQVSEDGLVYRFPFRDGVSYSTGDPVRPEDIRHGLERSIALSPDAAGLFSTVDGAKECHQDPSACDLSDSIVVDEESVTFHLARPDGDLPLKLTLPFAAAVPTAIPVVDQLLDPVPASGPYMIAKADFESIELVRNPEFREWSGAAQPDGFVDRISWRFGEEKATAFDRVNAGDLDLMIGAPLPQDLASLRAAHPTQVIESPQAFTLFVGFDVLKPPFDDARVRQAVNYALDRQRAVEMLGGPTIQRPTCQILPPNFQGYSPTCPYTLEPTSGVWSAPDLDRAQRLIEEAGAVGARVTAWVMDSDPNVPDPAGLMTDVVHTLNDLGLHAELKVLPSDEYFDAVYQATAAAGSPGHPQLYLSGWIRDYSGASNFIDPQFGCGSGGNPSGYCSPSLDARMDEALRLQGTDPGAANRAWTEIEHQLVEEAAQAPLTNPVFSSAVSARVGDVQVHPQWGILLSRLWVQ
jgi:peptide/nickel transport system substrate-binding protein